MVALGQRWAEEFMKTHPDIIVSVTGGGTGTGITALIQGSCDVAQASRRIEPRELEAAEAAGQKLIEHVVALDGIAVIVHPTNPVDKFTLPQLSDMYQGKITNWRQVGGAEAAVVLLARETSSGTHVFFKECVLQLDGKRKDADYANSAILSTSNQAIHDEVAANPNAIGYVGIAYVDDRVKAVAVAAEDGAPYIKPSTENVVNRTYPVARPLFAYTSVQPSQAVQEFLAFVASPMGEAIVEEVGFVAVPEGWAEKTAGPGNATSRKPGSTQGS